MYKLNPLAKIPVKESKIATFDIETINWIEPYALGFYDGKETLIFKGKNCLSDFVDFLIQKKYRNVIVYAHNGGKFDFNFLLEELNKKKMFLEIMRIGSRITQILVKDRHRNTWIIRDSMGFFGQLGKKSSLASLSENFKVENRKGEFEHAKINWTNWEKLESEWKPYLVNDCRALFEVMQKFQKTLIERFGVNLRKNITIAQLSMNVYRLNFLNQSIVNHKAVEKDIRKAYKGGRVEIFKQVTDDANYYDINSLYPYVMKKYPMPVGSPIKSFCFKRGDFGVCYASVKVPENLDIPILPYKLKSGKLVFPSGEFTDWFCSPEIEKAFQLGYEIKIHYGYKFQKSHIFNDYIDVLYKIKQNSERNGVDYMISKLLMNSLYGKFGQKRNRKKLFMNPETIIGTKDTNSIFFEEEIESKSTHILPAIACFVTSYARLELYKYLENSDPIYCDTDSIVTKNELPIGEELGELKLEHKLQEAYFLLPKMYALKDSDGKESVKCKGFSKNDVTFEMIKTAVLTGVNTIKYERNKFALVFESLKRNKKFVSMVNVKRSVKTKYDKRVVTEEFRTKPLHICNEEPKSLYSLIDNSNYEKNNITENKRAV